MEAVGLAESITFVNREPIHVREHWMGDQGREQRRLGQSVGRRGVYKVKYAGHSAGHAEGVVGNNVTGRYLSQLGLPQ